jgi:hypothetical protein
MRRPWWQVLSIVSATGPSKHFLSFPRKCAVALALMAFGASAVPVYLKTLRNSRQPMTAFDALSGLTFYRDAEPDRGSELAKELRDAKEKHVPFVEAHQDYFDIAYGNAIDLMVTPNRRFGHLQSFRGTRLVFKRRRRNGYPIGISVGPCSLDPAPAVQRVADLLLKRSRDDCRRFAARHHDCVLGKSRAWAVLFAFFKMRMR